MGWVGLGGKDIDSCHVFEFPERNSRRSAVFVRIVLLFQEMIAVRCDFLVLCDAGVRFLGEALTNSANSSVTGAMGGMLACCKVGKWLTHRSLQPIFLQHR